MPITYIIYLNNQISWDLFIFFLHQKKYNIEQLLFKFSSKEKIINRVTYVNYRKVKYRLKM